MGINWDAECSLGLGRHRGTGLALRLAEQQPQPGVLLRVCLSGVLLALEIVVQLELLRARAAAVRDTLGATLN